MAARRHADYLGAIRRRELLFFTWRIKVFVETYSVAKRIDYFHESCIPGRYFDAGPHVLVILGADLAMEFIEPGHYHKSGRTGATVTDRKSTRLNSSHGYISYAVFCLKKKKKKHQ